MELVPCVLCGAREYTVILQQKDLSYGVSDEVYQVVRCAQCHLLYLNPRPTASEISKFYPEEYFPINILPPKGNHQEESRSVRRNIKVWLLQAYYGYPDSKSHVMSRLVKKIVLFPEFLQRVIRGKEPLPFVGRGRLLDVGCGPGVNLATYASWGWDVYGIELSQVALAQAQMRFGERIQAGTLRECTFEKGYFDAVLFNHSLEHMYDPIESLMRASELLAPGGMVYITVPNAGSLEAKLFEKWWYPWELPRHLYHFDSSSLNQIIQKAGLEPVRMRTGKGSLFFLASLERVLVAKGYESIPCRKLLERTLIRPLSLLCGHLGYGSEISIHARKN